MQFPYDQTQLSNIILGQKVLARHRDRLLHPAKVEAWETSPAGDLTFTLLFEDGFAREAKSHELLRRKYLGQNSTFLYRQGDNVRVRFQGKDRSGTVTEQNGKYDQVMVKLEGTGDVLACRVDESRLVADALRPYEMKEARTYFPWQDISEVLGCNAQPAAMDCSCVQEQSDVRQAAMALTALSLSPVVPDLSRENGVSEYRRFVFPPAGEQSFLQKPDIESKPRSFSLDSVSSLYKVRPRPYFQHQCSVPTKSAHYGPSSPGSSSDPVSPKSFDEGFASSDSSDSSDNTMFKKKRSHEDRKRKVFKCTWRGCSRILPSLNGIISHVRMCHLGPETGNRYQDGEEEFYFNKVDLELDSDIESASLEMTSPCSDDSSLNNLDGSKAHNHIVLSNVNKIPYYDKRQPVTSEEEPRDSEIRTQCRSQGKMESSDKGNFSKLRKVRIGRVRPTNTRGRPSKAKRRYTGLADNTEISRGTLGENVKKCRKVYGMESKHLWCTQCRWKKACVRFR